MPLTIRVTQDDIEKGVRYNPWRCPIALAAIRAIGFPTIYRIGVGSSRLFIEPCYIRAEARAIPLPKSAQDWSLKFDCQEPVEPFSFTIEF